MAIESDLRLPGRSGWLTVLRNWELLEFPHDCSCMSTMPVHWLASLNGFDCIANRRQHSGFEVEDVRIDVVVVAARPLELHMLNPRVDQRCQASAEWELNTVHLDELERGTDGSEMVAQK